MPERIKELRRGPHGGPRGCSGAESIKPILPTFTGKGNNIFDISTLTQEFWTVFLLLPSNPYPTGQTTKQHTGQSVSCQGHKGVVLDNYVQEKFANRFGIELMPDARGTQANTLFLRDGKLFHNFNDYCRLYQYEVSQGKKRD